MRQRNRIQILTNLFVVVGLLAGLLSVSPALAVGNRSSTTAATNPPNHSLQVSETGLYIVRLSDPSVSVYMGGISGLDATSPQATGASRLDAQSPASLAYRDYLAAKQQALIESMQTAFGHPIDVQFRYLFTLDAIAVNLTYVEALLAFDLPGVMTVYPDLLYEPDTDMGPTLIGAPSIWNGDTIGDIATKGEGVVIGMIDTGINSQHPSFAATGGDGYTHTNPYGTGVYHGWCTTNAGFCNDKLIGAYGLNPVDGDPEDTDGHGSHTGSTAGGNAHEAVFMVGSDVFTRTISGVAPHANIVAYQICNPSCPGSAAIAAVDLAIGTDMVDVINYSISGGDNPWGDSVDLAFLDAFAAGIFVSASAGNAGPGAGTVAHTGPWNSSVAASTHSRIIANLFDVIATNGELIDLPAVTGNFVNIGTDITDNILYAGDVDPANINACVAFPTGSFDGVIGLVQRGGCTFDVKINNLANAGAIAGVIFNNAGGPPITMGFTVAPPIPGVMITLDNGLAVADLITGDPAAVATIYAGAEIVIDPAWEDIMAGFSSRGPSQFELLKPDYTAPGVNILAAVATDGVDPVQYGFLQGTSMSSPHSAGSAALMMALRPAWSIAMIRSAMNSTADPSPVLDSDGLTPANAYAMGSGRLALGGAGNAGLVLDETYENYVAANPAIGGEPNTLNQPSMVNYDCSGSCSWVRTVTSVNSDTTTWTAMYPSPDINFTVTPEEFTLTPGESVSLTITADVTTAEPDDLLFGDITLEPLIGVSTHLPVVIVVGALPPQIVVNPTELISTQIAQSVTRPLSISNLGELDLNWELYDGNLTNIWADNFDSYYAGSQMHGQGGWKGWANNPSAGAIVSTDYSYSPSNSVAIEGASDLVHEYTDFNINSWNYTAWQYIPTGFTGESYFILLNTYSDDGADNNWSTQINFNSAANQVQNEGASGGTLPLIKDEWVELRVSIDLVNDTQSFYYDDQLLFTGTWTQEQSGAGALNIGAVDLFANGASVVYYDDISLMPAGDPACGIWGDVPWLSTDPTSGTTPGGGSNPVDVFFDATGMAVGVYTATLCAASNDPLTPILPIPVTLNVVDAFWISLPLAFK
jgi:subtilisin family serine protease